MIKYLDDKLSDLFGVKFNGTAIDLMKYVFPRTALVAVGISLIVFLASLLFQLSLSDIFN